jgi:hypothetical protein
VSKKRTTGSCLLLLRQSLVPKDVAVRLALLPKDFEKYCSDTPTPEVHVIIYTIVTMKNRLALAIAIALTVTIFSFLNLSLGGGVYYYNRLTDEFKEVILDRSRMKSHRQNALPHPDDYTEIINNNGNDRSLPEQTSPSTPFIVTEADLDTAKHAAMPLSHTFFKFVE